MFSLDKLVLKFIIKKCTELGGIFYLGPVAGAIIYLMFIAWGVSIVLGKKKGVKK
ncbi:hypothetical protein [Clostridium omnivorum]|uniref:Uncharacterized protein n=1 Tax=Clostridium omnivorum TaxID=1604902 RepID=A0ABQ5NC73_9CLOT|nr:hypothetical protein [Clostridium sp. E14]GLC32877.1 hypothetical protein bsdE14_42870 [Clostridium sp. E14]